MSLCLYTVTEIYMWFIYDPMIHVPMSYITRTTNSNLYLKEKRTKQTCGRNLLIKKMWQNWYGNRCRL